MMNAYRYQESIYYFVLTLDDRPHPPLLHELLRGNIIVAEAQHALNIVCLI